MPSNFLLPSGTTAIYTVAVVVVVAAVAVGVAVEELQLAGRKYGDTVSGWLAKKNNTLSRYVHADSCSTTVWPSKQEHEQQKLQQ